MALDPYQRLSWRGVTANRRTIEMLEITELRALRTITPLAIPQGSYSGGVSASGGTHNGGGALDISVRGLTSEQRDTTVLALRKTGFAAWYRPYLPNVWPAHIHAIAIGDKELSAAAKDQVADYYAGRNGLANNGPDNGPRISPIPVYRQDIDMSYYGPEKWDADDWKQVEAKLITRVFEVVWQRDGAVRNLSVTDENSDAARGPASWFLSDIENTQDADHAVLATMQTDVKAILEKVTNPPA